MFDLQVAQLTAMKVAELLCFIAIGYALRHWHKIPKESVAVVSILCAWVFVPAYNITHIPKTFTLDALLSNTLLIITGAVTGLVCILLARFVGRFLGKTDFEKRSLTYIFSFANTAFFGYPVLEAVFGTDTLGRFIIFCVPLSILINSYGYNLFASQKGFSAKRLFLAPTFLSTVFGCILGLTGWTLPSVLSSTLSVAGGCMSSAAMILTGLVLGAFPIGELLIRIRPYFFALIQLLAKPLLGFGFLYLLKRIGLPSELFFFAGVFLCLPVGLNCVVFPESFGHHAEDNAKICFISFLMSILTLPVLFSLLKVLSGVN